MVRLVLPIRSAFAAAVALTLAFGASQAFADPVERAAAAACTDDICQAVCEAQYPDQEVVGHCAPGGCRCLL